MNLAYVSHRPPSHLFVLDVPRDDVVLVEALFMD